MYEGGDNKAVTGGRYRQTFEFFAYAIVLGNRTAPRSYWRDLPVRVHTGRATAAVTSRYASQWQGPSASPGADGPTWKSDDDARQLRCVQNEERLKTTRSLTEALSHADPTYRDLMADIDRLSEELAEVRESRMAVAFAALGAAVTKTFQ